VAVTQQKIIEGEKLFRTISDIDVKGKRVLLRVDLNVPMKQGKVQDKTRIERVIPTIKKLVSAGAKVIIASHFDRPNGKYDPSMSLAPLVDELAAMLEIPVAFAPDCVGAAAIHAVENLRAGQVLLLENLRFHAGEEANDEAFAKELAAFADVFVNDAFSCSHRAHASITGVAKYLPAVAGCLMQAELDALEGALQKPDKPVAAIVGGSKISTKIKLLNNLVGRVEMLIIGGGMANTFLYAKGIDVGKSLCETGMKEMALQIMETAKSKGCEIILPVDAVCAQAFKVGEPCEVVDISAIPANSMMLDVGPQTVIMLYEKLAKAKTILWNGPLGAFETQPFDNSTVMLARMVSALTKQGMVKSIAGGGDTVSALAVAGVTSGMTYVSTAGGAFLEWLEGEELPGVAVLKICMEERSDDLAQA